MYSKGGAVFSPKELAAKLSQAGRPITEAQIKADVRAGAPAERGRLHLLHYAAWLLQQRGLRG